ncbi:MAG: hypothetical protein QXP31_07820 [Pyrobaculum sp.]
MGWSDEAVVVGVDTSSVVGALVLLTFAVLVALWHVYVVAATFGALAALILYSHISASRRVEALLKALDEGRPLKLTAGVLETYYLHRGRHSRSWARFSPTGEAAQIEPGPYLYVGEADWEYLRAYAFRVEDSCCRGLYVIAVEPSQAHALTGEIAASTPAGDWASARIRPLGPGAAEASIQFYKVKARAARLELEVEVPGERKARIKLAETAEGNVTTTLDLSAGPAKIVIVGSTRLQLRKTFGRELAGLAPGVQYKLRLVLDTPLARDVVEELLVTPTKPQ